jgi:hypothetical protein
MLVGLCTIHLSLPGVRSLKEKRGVLKPLIHRLRGEFNVSAAEVDRQDAWQAATLGLAIVSSPDADVHGALEGVLAWLERTQPHVFVTDWRIEVI